MIVRHKVFDRRLVDSSGLRVFQIAQYDLHPTQESNGLP
jgi:hypothetical protein